MAEEKIKLSDFCKEVEHGDVLVSIFKGKVTTVRRQKIKRETKIQGLTAHYDLDKDIEIEHD